MEKSHLIIFERSMNSRFINLATVNNISYSTMDMDNSFRRGVLMEVISRIMNRKTLSTKINELSSHIQNSDIDKIFVSNTEGYIGHTSTKILKKRFPKIKFIVLQHGIFPLEKDNLKKKLLKIINKVTFFYFDICVFGEGFGSLIVDKYIVYGNREKEFLVKIKKWDYQRIEVDLKFLKSYLLSNGKNNINYAHLANETILLLQNLADSNLCSWKTEKLLIEQTLQYLSIRYTKVNIKEHPFCQNRLQYLKLPDNVEILDNMIAGFNKSVSAYSFFSTALIDAKFYNLKTFAIFSKKVKVKKSIYQAFDNIIDFEDEINL